MRKQISLLILTIAVFGAAPAIAAPGSGMRAGSSADLTGAPGVRARTSVDYEKYETRSSSNSYDKKESGDIYYTKPSDRSAIYKDYSSTNASGAARTETVRTSRSETIRREVKRKYYLAHPFFQPLKGKFGSVTDFAYNTSSYDVNLTPYVGNTISDLKAEWDMSQFSIKEDLSYGISDRLAVLGMARFASSDYKFDWSVAPDDKQSESKIDLVGLGLQWRFADNAEWIATLSGYYQHQFDIADTFVADLKAGYKVNSSTIYGLARAWMVDFEGNSYGNGVTDNNETMFIAYQSGDSSAFYIEGGVGVFSVLDEDWTLNLEAVFGNYDWHNQASLKAAIGWQPGDGFALNLYAKTAVYDSADGKDLGLWWNNSLTNYAWANVGTANVDNFSETTIGLQAIFLF